MKKLIAWFKGLFAPRPLYKNPKKWDAQFEREPHCIEPEGIVDGNLKESRQVEAKLPQAEKLEMPIDQDLIEASTEPGFYQKTPETIEAEMPKPQPEKATLLTKRKKQKTPKTSRTRSKARNSKKKLGKANRTGLANE